jgi:enoyl-[acyl-carrier protein] reductase I
MKNKKGLIMGVANERSIAWGIAKELADQGADLTFTYQNEGFKKRLIPLMDSIKATNCFECDVSNEEHEPNSIENVFKKISSYWNEIDFVVHALAFSDKEELKGKYINCSRQNFLNSLDISAFSFTRTAKSSFPLMSSKGGSLLTLSYIGAERTTPNYNVMGVAKAALESSVRYLAADLGSKKIRVNSLSAGPIKTLAASGIGDFRYILKWNQYNSPLRRNVTLKDVGGSGVYLLSNLSAGVTGETHHVDCGYHIVGMKAIDAPDMSPEKKEI